MVAKECRRNFEKLFNEGHGMPKNFQRLQVMEREVASFFFFNEILEILLDEIGCVPCGTEVPFPMGNDIYEATASR